MNFHNPNRVTQKQIPSESSKSEGSSVTKSRTDSKQDNSLEEAFRAIQNLRKARSIRIATTWPDLWNSLNSTCKKSFKENLTVNETEILQVKHEQESTEKEHRLAQLRQDLEPGGQCAGMGLSEGEAAAVLLYTAEGKSNGDSLYALVNNSLRRGQLEQVSVFVATLVSALRKLRDHSQPVSCACHWCYYLPVGGDNHYIACGFFSATRHLTMQPRSLQRYSNSFYVIPHQGRVAALPSCLSFHKEEGEVIFEPGTAFRRVTITVFEELPPADTIPVSPPKLFPYRSYTTKKADGTEKLADNTLFPEQQTQLVFPPGTRFVPLARDKPVGDPPVRDPSASPK